MRVTSRTLDQVKTDDQVARLLPDLVEIALDSDEVRSAVAELGDSERERGVDLDHLRRLAAASPSLSKLWRLIRTTVRSKGVAVVRGVPVERDHVLLALSLGLGTPTSIGNGDLIHDVTPRPPEQQGDVSSTRSAFALHTDSATLARPHDYVALACVEAAEDRGGESKLMHVDSLYAAICARFGSGMPKLLEAPIFPFPLIDPPQRRGIQQVPILTPTENGWTIRYRREFLAAGLRHKPRSLSTRHHAALVALNTILAAESLHLSYSLARGDVLIVDNHRVLHGRTAIHSHALRRLRRLKIFSHRPGQPK